jgi:2-polyprenyl-3-methyl-5-hydroxy-6-metoxy-1,4-benzoquinol methylase
MEDLFELTECVACGSEQLEPTLNLGDQPLANTYTTKSVPMHEYYPLAVNRCVDCNHLQLTHIVNPEIIYKNYAYVSGTSQTYLDYMQWFAKWCREYADVYLGHVLDIGCNDGSQLDAFQNLGFLTYGVDPAENLHHTSSQKGHHVVCGFWNKKSIKELKHNKFDIVTCQNAFAHNTDPVKFLNQLSALMNKNGMVFIQTSQANMIRNSEFDTIYHEHISFYCINSFDKMVRRTEFNLIDVIKTPIHGTSYVFVLSKDRKRSKHVKNLIAMEADLANKETYTQWAGKCHKTVSEFASRINLFREQGYHVVGYGAAAKGNTLLNFARANLDFVIDDNETKQGKITPGRDIPIVSAEHLTTYSEHDKVLFVPLAWNFFTEIKTRILKQRSNKNDRFLRYFPEVTVEH